mmetsp:Transcript_149658/g.363497  ORF Transcript_149658/g.363497 Transcript_149658/m.363497 type:complete len:83 (-) Transcript_149658:225-473(-)
MLEPRWGCEVTVDSHDVRRQSYNAALAASNAARAEPLMPAEMRNIHAGVVTGLRGDSGQSWRIPAELPRCSGSRQRAARPNP